MANKLKVKEMTGGTEGVRVTIEQDETHPLAHLVFIYNPDSGEMVVKIIPSYLVTKLTVIEVKK